MKQKYIYFLIAIIFAIAIFFRFFLISSVPPSPSLDEVTTGYNAYSILHTGRDEYGYFLPILLRAYDDWRPAGYVYFVIPFIKLFGLSVLAVRLPSVVFSILTIIGGYFLAQELFFKHKYKKYIALSATFLLSISPWNIYISRLGHEVNFGLVSVVFSTLFFLMAINRKNNLLLFVSCLLFGFSFYTYQSEKVFVPLLVILLSICFLKEILQMEKTYIIGGLIAIAIAMPMFIASFSPQGLIRLKGTSAFSDPAPFEQTSKQLLVDKQNKNIFGEIIHNRRFVPIIIFAQNYVSHFNPSWLFGNSGEESFKAPGIGLFYPWESILLLVGLSFVILLPNIERKIKIIILGWILFNFVAPAITTQAPHAMRSYTLLPIPQIIEGLALTQIVLFINKKTKVISYLLIALVLVLSIVSSYQFYEQYFFVFPKQQSKSFQYALQQGLKYSIKNEDKYSKIVVSNTYDLYQSYMFYLFLQKYDPEKYIKNGGTKSGGFAQTHVIGKYHFRPIQWKKEEPGLYIGNINDFPQNQSILQSFDNLDGRSAVVAVLKQK